MHERGLYRTGFIFAILTAVSWAFFVIGGLTLPQGGEIGDVDAYLAAANSTGMLLYNWGGILGSVLAVPTFLAILTGFRGETGSVLLVPVVLGVIGLAYLTLGFMVDSGSLVYQFAPLVSETGAADAAGLATTAQIAQDSIEVTWALGSFLGYGGPILWMAVLFLRANQAPRWLNIVGILAGVAGFVWLGKFLPVHPPAAVVPILIALNIVLGMIWLIGLTGNLVRNRGA